MCLHLLLLPVQDSPQATHATPLPGSPGMAVMQDLLSMPPATYSCPSRMRSGSPPIQM